MWGLSRGRSERLAARRFAHSRVVIAYKRGPHPRARPVSQIVSRRRAGRRPLPPVGAYQRRMLLPPLVLSHRASWENARRAALAPKNRRAEPPPPFHLRLRRIWQARFSAGASQACGRKRQPPLHDVAYKKKRERAYTRSHARLHRRAILYESSASSAVLSSKIHCRNQPLLSARVSIRSTWGGASAAFFRYFVHSSFPR